MLKLTRMEIYKIYFLLTTFFYFFLFFNPNNKTLAIFFFIYLFLLYYFNKNFKKSLLLAYLASWPFNVGKTYVIEHVPAWQLNLPFRPYGIASNIIISIKEIFIVLMILVLIRDFFLGRRDVFKFDKFSFLLLLYFSSLTFASIFGSVRPEISLIYSFYSIKPLVLYWYTRNLIKNNKDVLLSSIVIFSSIIILQAVLASLQFIQRRPLGLSIEESQEFLPISGGIDEEIYALRPIGTFSHANWLAGFLLPYLFIFLPSVFLRFKKIDKIAFLSFLFALETFLLTLGRSAWVSFFIALIIFLFIVEKKWKLRLKLKKEILKLFYFSLPLVLPFTIFFLIPRLVNTFYAFEIYGGGYTRIELIRETWETIKQFPFFGVGLGMDIFYSYQRSTQRLLSYSKSIFSYFPEAVHNGYLHLVVQTGIFPLLIFLLLSALIFRELIKHINKEKIILRKILLLSLVLGLLSPFFNAFLQPFLPGLQKMIFLSIIYIDKKNLRQLI